MFRSAVWLCAFLISIVLMPAAVIQAAPQAAVESPASGAGAQVAARGDGEGSAEDEEFLQGVLRDAARGEVRRARRDLREYLGDFPDSVRALEALARIELESGRLERALEHGERLARLEPALPGAIVLLARLESFRGRHAEAEQILRDGIAAGVEPLALETGLSELLHERGRRDEAFTLAGAALKRIGASRDFSGDDLCCVARLHRVAGDLERAARAAVLAEAALNGRRGPAYRYDRWEPLLILGDLYRVTRLESGNRALETFADLFKANPNQVDALVGRAETRLYGRNQTGAMEDCEKALLLNPLHPGALAFKARILIRNGRYGKAMGLIGKGLAVNPRQKHLLAQKAACLFLRGDTAGSDEALRAALVVDPRFGAGFLAVGEALLYHYRFAETRDFSRRAVALDPDLNEGYILLARSCVNLGLEEEAEKALLESKERDPYEYPWRYNMLKILDELKTKKRIRTGNAIFLFDVDEWGVMGHYLPELFEASWAGFEKRYGIDPKGPILVEMFSDHRDFAVRTVGFTGLGALGACFGDVVTLLSPRTEGYRRCFNWVSTLHHEIAHIFTLKLSRHRVPRWLTEGCSVYEEQLARPTWDRDMQLETFNAWHNDRLIPIGRFNAAFHGSRVLFAYYQAGLFVKYVEETYGWDAVLAMLRAYARDLDTEDALAEALGAECVGEDARKLDEAFRDWVGRKVVASIGMIPTWSDGKRREFIDAIHGSPEEADLLSRAAWACYSQDKIVDARYYLDRLLRQEPRNASGLCLSGTLHLAARKAAKAEECFKACVEEGGGNFYVYLNLGNLADGKDDAEGAASWYRKALDAFPGFVGPNNPYELLAALHTRNGETEKAIEILKSFVDIVEHEFPVRLAVARHFTETERVGEAIGLLREAVEIDPFVRALHLDMGRALFRLGRLEEALEELDVAVLVKPSLEPAPAFGEAATGGEDYDTLAEVLTARAEVLLALGRKAAAREDIERALACRPGYQDALDLRKKAEE